MTNRYLVLEDFTSCGKNHLYDVGDEKGALRNRKRNFLSACLMTAQSKVK